MRDDAFGYDALEVGNDIGGEVSLLLPKVDEVLELRFVLRTIVKGGGACDKARQRVDPKRRKFGVAVALDDVVQDVVHDIEQVQPPPPEALLLGIVLQAPGQGG